LVTLVIINTAAQAIPVQFGGNGHFYEAVNTGGGVNWTAAKAAAESVGGYLATITSSAENDFVYNLISHPDFWFVDGVGNSQGPYIGGYQEESQSAPNMGWKWVTGETWSYTNWAPGEPNDAGSTLGIEDNEENYLQYFKQGNDGGNPTPGNTWNDILDYSAVKGYVIEWGDQPELTTNPPDGGTLNFNEVRIGTNETLSITVTNTGNAPLSGTFPAASGEFGPGSTLPFGPLYPTESTSRDYTYTPSGHGVDSQNIAITSNGGNSTITLSGRGVGPEYDSVPPPNSTLDFGDVPIGSTGTLPFSISNVTTDSIFGSIFDNTLTDLTLRETVFGGPNASLFSLSGFTNGTVLSEGETLDFLVNFSPIYSPLGPNPTGIKSAKLTFLTDQEAPFGGDGLSFTYDLQGNATEPIPEPTTIILMGFGILGLAGIVIRQRRKMK